MALHSTSSHAIQEQVLSFLIPLLLKTRCRFITTHQNLRNSQSSGAIMNCPQNQEIQNFSFCQILLIMAFVFWDNNDILIDFMPVSITINTYAYCETLTHRNQAMQNKHRSILTSKCLFAS